MLRNTNSAVVAASLVTDEVDKGSPEALKNGGAL
jgi:hypothetical protein